jgi:hypothetical protein
MTRDLDDQRYKTQTADKDNTELKLNIEVMKNTFSQLNSDKTHLTLELKDSNEVREIYENKSK